MSEAEIEFEGKIESVKSLKGDPDELSCYITIPGMKHGQQGAGLKMLACSGWAFHFALTNGKYEEEI